MGGAGAGAAAGEEIALCIMRFKRNACDFEYWSRAAAAAAPQRFNCRSLVV